MFSREKRMYHFVNKVIAYPSPPPYHAHYCHDKDSCVKREDQQQQQDFILQNILFSTSFIIITKIKQNDFIVYFREYNHKKKELLKNVCIDFLYLPVSFISTKSKQATDVQT